jgi:benzoate membrane transport protein
MATAALADGGRIRRLAFRRLEVRTTTYLQDLNPSSFCAGLTAFTWYAVGLLPVQVAVTAHFGLTQAQVASWLCVIWLSGSVASIALSLLYRQPIAIAASLPALLFLATVADRFTFAELAGANMMAGAVVVALALLGLGSRVLRLLPLPIAMGMLAGSFLGEANSMIQVALTDDGVVAAATVGGYVVGRLVRKPGVPPIAIALLAGAVMSVATHGLTPGSIVWQPPALLTPTMAFTPSALVAVTLPLIVLSMGLGNVQGLGFLITQGYAVPVRATTFALGINSMINALFGGHVAIVSRNGIPIMAGPEAGAVHGRYWANLISAGLCIAIAVASGPLVSLLGILPRAFIVVLTGLAILPSLQNALERAFGEQLRFGAMVALVVAATPFTLLGVTSAFWALLASLGASYVAEREELLAFWRRGSAV